MNKASVILLLTATLCGCSHREQFTVEIDSPSLGTQQLTVEYTAANGHRVFLNPPAVDGRCSFDGEAPEPSLLEIFLSSGLPYRSFMVQDGDRITLRDDTIEGLTLPMPEMQTTPAVPTTMPGLELIVARDSTQTLSPEGVWIFTSSEAERTRQLLDTLRSYGERARDVYVGHSYDDWHFMVRRDTASWTRGLLPDAPLQVKALTATPMLIEADSAGHIVRRQMLNF